MDHIAAIITDAEIRALPLPEGQSVSVDDAHGLGQVSLSSIGGGVHVLLRATLKGDARSINSIVSAGDVIEIGSGASLAVFEKSCEVADSIDLSSISELSIGRSTKNDICIRDAQVSSSHAIVRCINGCWHIADVGSRNGTFADGRRVDERQVELRDGSVIFICGYQIEMKGGSLRFTNVPGEVVFSPSVMSKLLRGPRTVRPYPDFYRSPRIRRASETVEVEISPPPSGGSKPSISWLSVLLPPVMMVVVMVSISIFTNNRTMMFYTLPMSMIGVIMAVINYRSQMKKWRQTEALVETRYAEHLAEKENEIIDAETRYLTTIASSDPGVRECISIAKNVSRRLWERTTKDDDFLSVRLGTGEIASNVVIKTPREQLTLEEDPHLKDAAGLKQRHVTLSGVPVCHSFADAPITGLVGSREAVQETAWQIVLGIAAHHSPDDVKIVCVYPEREKERWEWIRWLPHLWNDDRSRRYIACTPDKARPMLRELAETLKIRRREASDRHGEGGAPTPTFFLLLADKSLVECSGEQFLPEVSSLGFTALYAYGDIRSLPGECRALIECGDRDKRAQGTIQYTDGSRGAISFMPDRIKLAWMDEFARALAPVRLRTLGASAQMPSYITFLQGLGVDRVEQLDVLGRWANSHPFKSIAAPIGVRENGDTFYFDIHEKGMGPHGIAAGATRWGKSETLTTWLLSVALHYRPDEVSFVLIDFKGDGLSGILMDLPHVAGVISNVDDITSIERNLRSLRGELIRRQRVFKETKLENIHKYQETRRGGRADLDPMPYLIVVIDEFAELKTQFPEQMDEFISIARVGGSLGVYMVLATQSPGGIVAGQVSANSRFRICLKTAEAGESKEILGTTDAFRITVRGRAYIKVGNNEVYEQVQTFYSKAPYRPDASSKGPSTEINIVELNGERVRPDTYDKTIGAPGGDIGEGRAVSSYIRSEAQKNDMPFARPVWTEALPKRLSLRELSHGREAFKDGEWTARNAGFSIVVGRVDNPEEQCQYPFILDFMRDGHQILYGAPSSGKTTFLQTAVMSAAQSYTPEQLHMLVLDFGNWGMKIFEGLPHMLMVADANDKEKMKKAEEYMLAQLESRKRLFAAEGVGTLDAYREVSGRSLPALLIAIDNMAALYNQYPDMMDSLIQVAREGGGLGVYLIVTAGSPGSFMYRIAQYVKSNHALQLTDRSDYRALVGGTGRQEPTHVAGRGFTRGPLEFQTALCADGASEGERVRALREICTSMREAWHGERASLEEAESKSIDASELSFTHDWVEIGIDKTTKEPFKFEFEKMNGCVITGAEGSGKSSLMAMIARAAYADTETDVWAYEEDENIERYCSDIRVARDARSADLMISDLADEFDSRDDGHDGRILFFIDDFAGFYKGITQESADILEVIARSGEDRGIVVYIACAKDDLPQMNIHAKPFQNCLLNKNVALIGGAVKEYTIFTDMGLDNEIKLQDHEALIHSIDRTELIRLANIKEE